MENFSAEILKQLPFEPTSKQKDAAKELEKFLTHEDQNRIFVLRGYAGTGKTSLVSALVRALPKLKRKSVLLAPTGRAAKVLSVYSGKIAWTIHKKIYRASGTSEGSFFSMQTNTHHNTLFIVDEASMIGEGGGEKNLFPNSLLDDLFHFVYQNGDCQLLFVGDVAQLPPVGLAGSPALHPAWLKKAFGFPIQGVELNEVVRQEMDSGVLYNATKLRIEIAEATKANTSGKQIIPKFELEDYKDVKRVVGNELVEELEMAYQKYGPEETIIICRSNKRANIYNQQIRQRIRQQEDEISNGDHIMIVKNNYFWLPEESKAGFIANGDTAVIKRIRKFHEIHGLRFADVTIQLLDYPEEPELDARIMLDTLYTEAPALPVAQQQQFYESVAADYADLSKGARYKKMKEDPWYNALQVKFAYAVTCHKAQGGQWKAVFVEQGYLTDEMVNVEFLRWLYTALTRTTEKVYLVGFNEDFFA
ncbi:MAG: AAA family ATPase [Bacteroidota bacterium]|nr:AAA family ATPase [Bacteroidota bacterium]